MRGRGERACEIESCEIRKQQVDWECREGGSMSQV